MKRLILLAALYPIVALAQQPLIDSTQMPNAVHFLPPPPAERSDAFLYDQSQYQWGKTQRQDSARLAIAVGDAVWSVDNICQIYSGVLGIKITRKNTPATYRMLTEGLVAADQVGKMPKNRYMRTRPYVYYNEPTIYPADEGWLRTNGSYPSGHTILGWSAALLLTEVVHEKADTILSRGYMYGQSRVIAGYHWQSDVDAGRLCASAAVARLHADDYFMHLMDEAKREMQLINHPWQSGDLVFTADTINDMAKAISESTGAYTHVAIVERDEENNLWLIEAVPDSGVHRLPLAALAGASKSRIAVCRLDMPFDTAAVITRAKNYIGRPYDDAFLPGDDRLYCSELVCESYRLFHTSPMRFRDSRGRMPRFWKQHYRRLGMPIPEGQPGSNPADLALSPLLKTMFILIASPDFHRGT